MVITESGSTEEIHLLVDVDLEACVRSQDCLPPLDE